ncbi:hypothetical protein [Povalibacter sp.]|uniref:hypothetical protein n=1 Tax=Povalibacter sp. TaxID=1962978 RepID=UPI002F41DDAA
MKKARSSFLTYSLQPAACSLLFLTLCACAPLPHREARAAHSSIGCMQAALRERLPANLPDTHSHCIAAGLIARYCSVTEATLASVGKEARDLLGSGDADWRDLTADRRGIRCARNVITDEALQACCLQTPGQPKR